MANDELTGGQSASRPGLPVDPFRLRRAILDHKKLLIGAGTIGLALGFVIAKFVLTSGYESTAVLKFEGIPAIEGMRAETELGPAADALRRQAVLRRIADDIEFGGTLTTLSSFIGYNIDLMGGTMSITTPGPTPQDAAGFARAVSDVFIRYHQERQAERIEAEILRVDQRIAAADVQADQARRAYNEFREAHGIADLSSEQQSMLESAAKLRASSELGVSEVRALEARVESLKAQLASTPVTTVVSAGTSPERAAYDQLRQQLATARATLSESHPQVQSLQQQVNEMRGQLRASGSSGSGVVSANSTHQAIEGQLRTAQSNLRALQERQRGMGELADKAQARVETFSDIEGEASSLLAEVKVSEGLMQELRRTNAALEDAMRNPSSGFIVLDPGSVPEYPLRNKAKVVVFGAVPMILFGLALLFALYSEFPGLRVQTPSEVAFWGSGPVLGTTSWPEDPHGLDELVAGLDDHAPDARGNVLIVGASPQDGPLAVELAERMNNDWVITGTAPRAAPASSSSATGESAPRPRPAVVTAPPAGPYPITSKSRSAALATRPSVRPIQPVRAEPGTDRVSLEAWDGSFEGQALRRAARLADRVLVLVRSGHVSALGLNSIQHRLGRSHGIGYVVLSLPEGLKFLSDRQGNVADYWMKRA